MFICLDLKSAEDDKVRKLYKRIVEEASPEILDRIIPQIYREELYNEIMNIYNFKSASFTCYTMSSIDENKITNFCAMNGIKVLTIDYRFLTSSLVEKCKSRGITLYMNTINDSKELNKYKSKGVQGFFTDFLNP